MTSSHPWYGRRRADALGVGTGLSRRSRLLIVAAEAGLAAVVGGAVLGGALGWTVAGAAVAAGGLGMLLAGGRSVLGASGQHRDAAELIANLRVHGAVSRSSGDVGVLNDAQGYAAGLELDIARGALLDLAGLCVLVADDPSRPSALQIRLTTYAPPAPGSGVFGRPRGDSIAVHRRLHILLRLEPAWASDVVAAHGGGAQGSRAALVAAVDRLAARLRRSGVLNRVLDTAALTALLAEDTAADLRARVFTADVDTQADLDRLIGVLQQAAPERSILSVSVDLASSDQWQSFAAVLVGGRDAAHTDAAGAAVLADPCVVGVAPASAGTAVLPLGGGPGDLTSVLTLARS
jgi:hypothetical protein